MVSVTYTPAPEPEHVPGTLTLELSEEVALYVTGVLGSGSSGKSDPPLHYDESPYVALYDELNRHVPEARNRIRRHYDAHKRSLA